MIIAKVTGGLGNQMFQYALGRHLGIKHNTIFKMDLTHFKIIQTEWTANRPYDLTMLKIQQNVATPEEIAQVKANNVVIAVDVNNFEFDEKYLLAPDNTYFQGFWQSEKFFKDIEDVIRKDFEFNFELSEKCTPLKERIESCNAVCIHVRRTDYINHRETNEFHGVCGMDYFNKGIQYIRERVENPHFFVFSDDVGWCLDNFTDKNLFTVVYHDNAGDKSKYHFMLMTLCKHYIISNSSFSWWGAWLNPSKDKIVIAPGQWFRDPRPNTRDIIPENWMKM